MTHDADVSAVVLSVGEPFLERALDSVRRQTVPCRDVVVIDRVSPFFRAINAGARQVRTPFFVQVDADMVLDPACVATLRAHAREKTGIVVGELRDELEGQVVGVKLFRTACFDARGMPDTVAQDTDFVNALARRGWETVYVDVPDRPDAVRRPALGDHRPDYTPSYTCGKFLLEGARLRHRAAPHGLRWRMGQLERSAHPMALLAQISLGHGFFVPVTGDGLSANRSSGRGDSLMSVIEGQGSLAGLAGDLLPLARFDRLSPLFRAFLDAGHRISEAGAGATLRDLFAVLSVAARDPRALVAKVALGHGLLLNGATSDQLAEDERAFKAFVLYTIGSRSARWERVRRRLRHLLRERRHGGTVPW